MSMVVIFTISVKCRKYRGQYVDSHRCCERKKRFKATQTGCLNISSSHFTARCIKLIKLYLDKYTILNCNIILNCESSGQYIKLSQGLNFPMSNLIMPLQIILRRNVNDRHKLHLGGTLHINYSITVQGRSLILLYGKSSVLL